MTDQTATSQTNKRMLQRAKSAELSRKVYDLYLSGMSKERIGMRLGISICSVAARIGSAQKDRPAVDFAGLPLTDKLRDDGSYMAAVRELGVAPPEECIIRTVRPRPLPTGAMSFGRQGNAAAMCAELGALR